MNNKLLKMTVIVGILVGGLLNIVATTIPGNALWVDGSAKVSGNGSKNSPYKTIKSALGKLSSGGTVVIKAGTYRENIKFSAGNSNKQTTIMAAPGERVVVSGARKITGWKSAGKGVYKTVIDWSPKKLFVNLQEQPLSRHPDSSWWQSSQANGDTIVATELKSMQQNPVNGEIYIWTQVGNVYMTQTVLALDKTKGECKMSPIKSKWSKLKNGDKFYFKNHPALINLPGEWASVATNGKFEIYFKPAKQADLANVDALWSTRAVVQITNANNLKITGLNIIKGAADGIAVMKSENIEITNCRVLHNYRNGISMRDVEKCMVKNNLVLNTVSIGIVVTYSKGVVVEQNEIAYGGMDGLVVAWKSQDVIINRNYIHHHYLWGHPDGFQMYRDVKNIKIIDNLLLMNGQGVMLSDADGMEFNGNMFIGCTANMLIFGHKNANDAKVINNTIAYPGYSCASFTGAGYEVYDNVMMLGQRGAFFGIKNVKNYQADRNLYWGAPGQAGTIYSDKGWHRTVDAFKSANPTLEKSSVYANPEFINAPTYYRVLDTKKLSKSSASKLFVRPNTIGFENGDYIEINFDGIVRKAVEVGKDYIVIDPALKERPLKSYAVANWKESKNFKLDLRLKSSSPGSKLNNGKAVGSSIDIQAFQRGDFNNDGKRDIPKL
jgi:parallel beta-helix repeat protein